MTPIPRPSKRTAPPANVAPAPPAFVAPAPPANVGLPLHIQQLQQQNQQLQQQNAIIQAQLQNAENNLLFWRTPLLMGLGATIVAKEVKRNYDRYLLNEQLHGTGSWYGEFDPDMDWDEEWEEEQEEMEGEKNNKKNLS